MSLRVLFGPVNIADQGPATARALTRLGIRATTYSGVRHPFYPDSDIQDVSTSRMSAITSARRFFHLAEGFDVVHLQSVAFLPPISRPVLGSVERGYLAAVAAMIRRLRHRGKVVAVTFHGSDVRTVDEIATRWASPEGILALSGHQPDARARRIRYSQAIAAACDLAFVTTPDLLPLVPGAMLSPVVPSRAFEDLLASTEVDPSPGRHGALRVLHAPSNPVIKGTALIERAVRRAQDAGVSIDFEVVSGAQTAKVVEAMLESDVVVDQVLFGWYGAIAVEAMALGRPAIARIEPGYAEIFGRATGREFQGLGPIDADAGTLTDLLYGLHSCGNDEWTAMRSVASQTYMEFHQPELIAKQYLEAYRRVLGASSNR